MKKFFTLIAVAVMAFAAQAATLTVCEGTETSYYLPIYGFWVDNEGTVGQTIYPADMLADMQGGKISQLKYYTNSEGIGFSGATLQLSFKVVDQNGFEYGEGAITEATAVATLVPEQGATEMVFDLTEPYEYNGGNLLVECKVIVAGSWASTFFLGTKVAEGYPSYYKAISGYRDQFMPMITFTYEEGQITPPEPPVVDQVGAPTFEGYTEDGIYGYGVYIHPTTEGSSIMYRIFIEEDGQWVLVNDWTEYQGVPMEIWMSQENVKYRIEAYAYIGEVISNTVAYEYQVEPWTSINEMNAGKTVAGVRYFNMAGQEMQEANGVTIVVTTYTDGTTSAVKVVK